jgi:DNA-binding transcriptional LysR family regulator
LDIVKFRAFCTVAGLHSISKAAEKLYYTQPAISTQIRGLENEYGARLFRRNGKRIELTEAGRELLPIAEKLLDLFEQSRNAVRQMAEVENHCVRIGASGMPGVHIVPELVAGFSKQYPQHTVSITVATAYQIERMMSDNEVDLGIVGRSAPTHKHKRFTEVELFEDPLVLVVGKDHPLASMGEIDPHQLDGEHLILPPHRILTRTAVEERLRSLGVDYQLSFEIAGSEAIKRMVINHLGSSIMCASVVQAETSVGWLQAIPVRGLNLSRKVYLSYPQDKESNPAIQQLVAFVLDRYHHGTRSVDEHPRR